MTTVTQASKSRKALLLAGSAFFTLMAHGAWATCQFSQLSSAGGNSPAAGSIVDCLADGTTDTIGIENNFTTSFGSDASSGITVNVAGSPTDANPGGIFVTRNAADATAAAAILLRYNNTVNIANGGFVGADNINANSTGGAFGFYAFARGRAGTDLGFVNNDGTISVNQAGQGQAIAVSVQGDTSNNILAVLNNGATGTLSSIITNATINAAGAFGFLGREVRVTNDGLITVSNAGGVTSQTLALGGGAYGIASDQSNITNTGTIRVSNTGAGAGNTNGIRTTTENFNGAYHSIVNNSGTIATIVDNTTNASVHAAVDASATDFTNSGMITATTINGSTQTFGFRGNYSNITNTGRISSTYSGLPGATLADQGASYGVQSNGGGATGPVVNNMATGIFESIVTNAGATGISQGFRGDDAVLMNAGMITSSNAGSGVSYGVRGNYTRTTNTGTIAGSSSGTGYAVGIRGQVGTINNNNGGTISAVNTGTAGAYGGYVVSGTLSATVRGTINNAGTINAQINNAASTANAVGFFGLRIDIANSGTISSATNGAGGFSVGLDLGENATLDNQIGGLIDSTATGTNITSIGVALNRDVTNRVTPSPITITNAGTIRGVTSAIENLQPNDVAGTANITNSGTIIGNIVLGIGDDSLTLQHGTTFNVTTANTTALANGGTGNNTLTLQNAAGETDSSSANYTNWNVVSGGAGNWTLSGIVQDGAVARSVAHNGTGNLILSGANTYRNGTTITSGRLIADNNSALGSATSATNNVTNSAVLQIGTTTNSNRAVTIGGAYTQNAGASLSVVFTSNNESNDNFTFLTSANGASALAGILSIDASALTLATNQSLTWNIVRGANLTTEFTTYDCAVCTTNGWTLTSNISNNLVTVTLLNTVVTPNNVDFFDASATAASATTNNVGGLQSLPGFAAGAYTYGAGAARDVRRLVDANGLTAAGGNVVAVSENITLGAQGVELDASNGNQLTLSGTISGGTAAGSTAIIYNGNGTGGTFGANQTGTIIISGNNSYTGDSSIDGGTIRVTDANAFSGGNVTLNGGILGVGLADTTQQTLTLNNNISLTATDNVINVSDTDSATLSGVVGGAGALTKNGTGTLTLSNTNNYGGGTTISGGTLAGSVTATGSSFGGGAITDNAALSVDTANGVTGGLAQVISGTGSLTKSGAGQLTLSNTNTYGGGTTISGGTLAGSVTATGSSFGAGAITNDAILSVDAANGVTGSLAQAISGTGSLTKTGAGQLTLSNVNAYGGGTTISGGTLAGSVTATGSSFGAGAITNNAALSVDAANGVTGSLAQAISGTGSLTKTGAGQLTLSNTNIYGGGTTISGGTLAGSVTATGSSFGAGAITNAGTLSVDAANGVTGSLAQAISGGTGILVKTGGGQLTLSNVNTYGGGTTISGGILAGSATATGSSFGNGAITNNAALSVDVANTISANIGQVISGTGSITKTGQGLLTLGTQNTYQGGTTISGGELIGTIGTTTSSFGTGNIVDNGLLTVNVANGVTGTLGQSVSGSGRFSKTAGGTLVVTGSNSYTGGTTLNLGTLVADNNNALGSATANTNALTNNGTLQIGTTANSNRAVTIGGAYTQGTNGVFSVVFTTNNESTDNITFLTSANGTSTLAGLLSIDASALTLTSGQTLTWNIVQGANLTTEFANYDCPVCTTNGWTLTHGTVNNLQTVTLANNNVAATNTDFLDAGATAASGSTNNVGGLQTTSAPTAGTYTYGAGTTRDVRRLVGADGQETTGGNVVTVAENIAIGASGVEIDASANNELRLNGVISDQAAHANGFNTIIFNGDNNGGFAGTQTGFVIVSGNNSYTGTTLINGGNVRAANANAFGGGAVNLNGGIFGVGLSDASQQTLTLTNALSLSATDNIVDVSDTDVATLSGIISGAGGLQKTGTGTLTLSNVNNYGGTTTINAGTLAGSVTATGSSFGAGGIANNAVLSVDVANGVNGILGNTLGGTGTFTKTGAGQLTLSNINNSYNGGTTISAGTLVGSVGATSSSFGTGAITNNAALSTDVGAGVTGSLAQAITGTGSLTKTGAGSLTLSNANSYAGGTTISAGRLIADNNSALGSATAATNNLSNSGTLQIGTTTNADRAVTIGGAYTQNAGAGLSIVFTANNESNQSFTFLTSANGVSSLLGTLTIDASAITLASGSNLTWNIVRGANLTTEFGTYDCAVCTTNGWTLTHGTANNLQTVTLANAAVVATNTDYLDAGATAASAATNNVGGLQTLPGYNSGTYTFGTGTSRDVRRLVGANGQAGTGGNNVTVGDDINIGAQGVELDASAGNTVTFSGIISDDVAHAGGFTTLILNGSNQGGFGGNQTGEIILTRTNNYTGDTIIGGGAVRVDNNLAFSTGRVSITGATLGVGLADGIVSSVALANDISLTGANNVDLADAVDVGALSGTISGTGSLNKTGLGALTLSGTNNFSGGLTLSTGTLTGRIYNSGSSFGTGNIVNNGTLIANALSADVGTLSQQISGSGSFEKIGAGQLTLSGSNSYNGGTLVSGGRLVADNASALGTGAVTNDNELQLGSTAPLRVNVASYNQTVGGNLYILAAPTSTGALSTSQLNVTGAATIAGNLHYAPSTGGYLIGSSNSVLTAARGLTGQFSNVFNSGSAFVTINTTYTATDVVATVASSVVTPPGGTGGGGTGGGGTGGGGTGGGGTGGGGTGGGGTSGGGTGGGTGGSGGGSTGGNSGLYSRVAYTFNQEEVGSAFDPLGNINQTALRGDAARVVGNLNTLNAAQARRAYDEIGGQIHPLSSTILRKSGERFFDLTYDRLGGQAGSILEGAQEVRLSLSNANALSHLEDSESGDSAFKTYARDRYDATAWLRGYGLFGDIDSNRNAAGADYTVGGFVAGVDKQFTRNFKAGLAFGYAHTDADADRGLGEFDADSYHFGIYGRYTPEDFFGEDGWFVDGLIGGGIHDVDTKRNIAFGAVQETAKGDYTNGSFLIGAQVGKEYKLSPHFRLVPSLGLHYQLIDQDNFKERGAGALNLSVRQDNDESLRLTPGFRFNVVDLEIAGLEISPSAYAGYQYEALDATKRIGARLDRIPGSDSFATQGPGLSRHTALFSVGVDAKADEDFDLFLRWDGTFSGTEDTNAVIGGFKYSW